MASPCAGRGFSALPLLTSASAKPHPLSYDHTPFHRDMAQGLGKVDEVHRDRDDSPSLSTTHTDGCPEDALFPKRGAATLLFTDCLNTKVKPKPDNSDQHTL